MNAFRGALAACSSLLLCSHALEAKVIKISNEAQYQETVTQSNQPVVLTFSAQWCSTCKHITAPLEEISNEEEFNNVLFAHIDIDQIGSISDELGIVGVPTFDYVHNGEKKERAIGIKDLDTFKDNVRSALRTNFNVAIHDPQRPLQDLDSVSHPQPLSYYDGNPEPAKDSQNEPISSLPPATHILHAPSETNAPIEPQIQTADPSILVPLPAEPTPQVPLYVETNQPISTSTEPRTLTTNTLKNQATTRPTTQQKESSSLDVSTQTHAPVKPEPSETTENDLPVAMEKTTHEEILPTSPAIAELSSPAEELLKPLEIIPSKEEPIAPAPQESGVMATIKDVAHKIGDMFNSAIVKIKGLF